MYVCIYIYIYIYMREREMCVYNVYICIGPGGACGPRTPPASRPPRRPWAGSLEGCIYIYIYIYIHTHTYISDNDNFNIA